jgi:hypothetical protein
VRPAAGKIVFKAVSGRSLGRRALVLTCWIDPAECLSDQDYWERF